MHVLCGNEGLIAELVAVGVVKHATCEMCAARMYEGNNILFLPARIVGDFFHDTTDVAIAFNVVEGTKLGMRLVMVVCALN